MQVLVFSPFLPGSVYFAEPNTIWRFTRFSSPLLQSGDGLFAFVIIALTTIVAYDAKPIVKAFLAGIDLVLFLCGLCAILSVLTSIVVVLVALTLAIAFALLLLPFDPSSSGGAVILIRECCEFHIVGQDRGCLIIRQYLLCLGPVLCELSIVALRGFELSDLVTEALHISV